MDGFLALVTSLSLFIASIEDFKKREVPDWLNFSLIFFGIAMSSIISILNKDISVIGRSVFGLIVSVILGYLMFYTGQWGGGDSKMIMALGAILGLSWPLIPLPTLILLYANIMLAGAVYGMVWVVVLTIIHWKPIFKGYKKIARKHKMLRLFINITALLMIGILFFSPGLERYTRVVFSILILSLYGMFYLWMLVKVVEKEAFIKYVEPEVLTEGEWIVDDIVVDGKRICGPKDLGIEKPQIAELLRLKAEGKVGKVKIKVGIPFIPSFFIAFVYTYFFGDLLFLGFLF